MNRPGWQGANSLIANWQITKLSPNSLIATSKGKITSHEADLVMESVSDLVTPAYRPKYFKALYRMGASIFMSYADRARKGKYPQHLFRHLIDGHK